MAEHQIVQETKTVQVKSSKLFQVTVRCENCERTVTLYTSAQKEASLPDYAHHAITALNERECD
jgi:uncharacterized protein with PIN domain